MASKPPPLGKHVIFLLSHLLVIGRTNINPVKVKRRLLIGTEVGNVVQRPLNHEDCLHSMKCLWGRGLLQ